MTSPSPRAPRITASSLIAAMSALLFLVPPASGQSAGRGRAGLFEKVAGSWSGAGTISPSGGNPERLRCRADYAPTSASQLRLALRCASDSFNLQISSAVTRNGDQIAGEWREAGSGASGDLSGVVGANQLQAVISGPGLSARLTLTMRGDVQAITLSSQGQISASASILLRRS